MKKPELLMPAGNLEKLKIALNFGADAVYLGDKTMSLRAAADNFTIDEIREGIKYAHDRGKKVYVAANLFAHNEDLAKAMKLFLLLKDASPDAILISDPGVFSLATKLVPDIPIHISTQANNTNFATYDFWYNLGVRRVVSARELSLTELRGIRDNIPEDMEIESFVHGAMCISYSGRCLISNFLTSRDANQGACTHPCRWSYNLVEENRPGEYMPVYEDDKGTYLYHSKDLCMIGHIPELIEAGIDSFKVEGRMKNPLYVATIARTYRQAIDDYCEDPELYKKNLDSYIAEVGKSSNRSFCTGFYFGKPGPDSQIYDCNVNIIEYIYLGTIFEEDGRPAFIQKNKFMVGDEVEILRPGCEPIKATLLSLENEKGEKVDGAPHASEKLYPDFGIALKPFDIMRKPEK